MGCPGPDDRGSRSTASTEQRVRSGPLASSPRGRKSWGITLKRSRPATTPRTPRAVMPSGRIVDASEVAYLATFLASDKAWAVARACRGLRRRRPNGVLLAQSGRRQSAIGYMQSMRSVHTNVPRSFIVHAESAATVPSSPRLTDAEDEGALMGTVQCMCHTSYKLPPVFIPLG